LPKRTRQTFKARNAYLLIFFGLHVSFLVSNETVDFVNVGIFDVVLVDSGRGDIDGFSDVLVFIKLDFFGFEAPVDFLVVFDFEVH